MSTLLVIGQECWWQSGHEHWKRTFPGPKAALGYAINKQLKDRRADLLMEAVVRAFLIDPNHCETTITVELANVIITKSKVFARMLFILLDETSNDMERDPEIMLGLLKKCIAVTKGKVLNIPPLYFTNVDTYALNVLLQSWITWTWSHQRHRLCKCRNMTRATNLNTMLSMGMGVALASSAKDDGGTCVIAEYDNDR
ncbi:hypothetical protein BC829DRAFT_415681 [Chytridium lagenaria]|nr:hypothetical protein BC829DRAFT_415681 [Chytridium lagenaria]